MILTIILLFILGYVLITLEHPLKLDKAATALLMATIIWGLLALGFNQGWISIIDSYGEVYNIFQGDRVSQNYGFQKNLVHHFSTAGEILFFLIGAMTIVEIIDLHRGFDIIKNNVTTKSRISLLWKLGILTFLLSAVIDNLTAMIIMVSVLRKIVPKIKFRVWYIGLMVIATNAGGVWSPIGDVTTTMLWIGNKVTVVGLLTWLIVPAIVCFVIPFYLATRLKAFQGEVPRKRLFIDEESERLLSSKTMLYLGLSAIIFVPVFKTLTGLPPYMGMLFSLGVVWVVSEYIKPVKNISPNQRRLYSTHKALSKVEMSSILFFLGILLAVFGLESMVFGNINGITMGTLRYAAESLSMVIPNMNVVVMLLGAFSAMVDNVPLVAAAMAMYDFPLDDPLWFFIAYAAGTGGNMLIIGSAPGIAAMGMENVNFFWYLKNITLIAAVGFIAGGLTFLLMQYLLV